ncbi:Uncharacterised protein [Campylobacter hyointestinalis subsp. hyointestinalis]|uniref:Uncharacterized protein n=1 Tax=Campylobacter hyointestinalis subsp. hyointestinalis TaxID=91352 RepID=A0A0S4STS5_CAMHY|nr:hypothetical protein [Campylobacter hyointestinalis]CUU89854.1 Uncharacterised protein [Campylobacter hyointestinalis subsp. hyointestinalis]
MKNVIIYYGKGEKMLNKLYRDKKILGIAIIVLILILIYHFVINNILFSMDLFLVYLILVICIIGYFSHIKHIKNQKEIIRKHENTLHAHTINLSNLIRNDQNEKNNIIKISSVLLAIFFIYALIYSYKFLFSSWRVVEDNTIIINTSDAEMYCFTELQDEEIEDYAKNSKSPCVGLTKKGYGKLTTILESKTKKLTKKELDQIVRGL